MAFFLAVMIARRDAHVTTVGDYAIPIVGAAFALLWAGAMYVSHRAQTLREQRFGESLRDQLRRRIAQLDYEATRAVRVASVLATQLPPMVCATAFLLASWRINGKSFRDDGYPRLADGRVRLLIWHRRLARARFGGPRRHAA